VLVGRTLAPDSARYTQRAAVVDALGGLGVPVVLDVECGHVPPRMPLVNGAVARVGVDDARQEVTQTLV
jgi:muramoyltetrapeptide carboxypeptidase LdcA involved in peptidoglycan recycling